MTTGRKALGLAYRILSLAPKVFTGLLKEEKEWRVQARLILGLAAVVVMSISLTILLATLVSGFVALIPNTSGLGVMRDWSLPFAAAVLALVASLPQSWRSALTSSTDYMLAFFSYVAAGVQRDAAVGTLASFMTQLVEGERYERIHIVAYSIGSVIALDAVFPTSPPIQVFRKLDTLTTIGCPGDIIQTFWDDYFQERYNLAGVPRRWINIFIPSDLLASNFIFGNYDAETPEEAIEQRRQRLFGFVQDTRGLKKVIRKFQWSGVQLLPAWQSDNLEEPLMDSAGDTAAKRGRTPLEIRSPINVRRRLVPWSSGPGLSLAAARSHRAYWHWSNVHAASVFDTVVESLLPFSTESQPP